MPKPTAVESEPPKSPPKHEPKGGAAPQKPGTEPDEATNTQNSYKSLFKPPKPQKKNQIAGFNTVRLLTMMMHHLKKDLKLEITGNEIIENVFEVNNQGIMKMHPPGSSTHGDKAKDKGNIITVP